MNIAKLAILKRFMALVIVGLALSPSVYAGKIYKTVNKDGTISYSDQPTPGAVEIDLDSNTTTVLQNRAVKTKQLKTIKQKKPVEHILSVTSPPIDGTVRNTTGNVTISASVTPNAPGRYELSLHELKLRSTSGTFLVKDLPRGEYSYQINFVSASGKVIASSPVRRFFMHKPSALIKPRTNSN
jgi:hypothetical protein